MTDTGSAVDTSPSGFLFRPLQTLQVLPFEWRWEFTRRHPYYLDNWSTAHKHYAGLLTTPLERTLGQFAVVMLLNVGITADPPPPGAPADQVNGNQLAAAWRDGAVAPATFRGLALTLLKDLPPETRRLAGQALVDSVAAGADEVQARFDAAMQLTRSGAPRLAAVPNRPIVGVNVNAPQRAIVTAIEQMVREWKEQAGVPERRRRDDLLQPCLTVWDLREGWTGEGYDVARERTFTQIASALHLSPRTVANRYYAAFELLSGHAYSVERWVRVFSMNKLSGVLAVQALSRRRVIVPDRAARSVDAVSESTLDRGNDPRGGALAREAGDGGRSQAGDLDLLLDITELTGKGLGEDAIIEKLELTPGDVGRAIVRRILDRACERAR